MNSLKIIKDHEQIFSPLSNIKSIIAVAAGKGGVGKSSISVNLALGLKQKGFNVGLLDADVYGPSLKHMLPKDVEPTDNPENPDQLMPAHALGIPFISVAHFKKEASIVRAPIANQIIEQFLNAVNWGSLDFLIIDFPPGTGDIQLTLMQKAKICAAIVVTTPQSVSILDVRKAIQLFEQMDIPIVGVIENMSYFQDPLTQEPFFPFGKGGGEELSGEFGIPLIGKIPLDPLISEMGDKGESLFEQAPASSVAKIFEKICDTFLEEVQGLNDESVEIRQRDPYTLEIKLDGEWKSISVKHIQSLCPCAQCKIKKNYREDVSCLEFSHLGRYAIKLNFSSGCKRGIYPFSLLRKNIV